MHCHSLVELLYIFSINHSPSLLLFQIEAKADVVLLPAFGFVKFLSIQTLLIYLWQWVTRRQIDHFLCVSSRCWKLKQGLVFNSCLSLEWYFWGWKAALGWLSPENSWGWCAVWDCSSHVPQEGNWIQLFHSCAAPFISWQLWEQVLNCWKSNV